MKLSKLSGFTVFCLFVALLAYLRLIVGEVAPYAPLWDDQGYYLVDAHKFFDFARNHGYWNLMKAFAAHDEISLGVYPSAATTMSLLASFLFSLFGATRIGALTVHLGAWLALVAGTAVVINKTSRSHLLVTVGLGLILALGFPFVGPGGLADFRMDFAVACWNGVIVGSWLLFLLKPSGPRGWLAAGLTFSLFVFRIVAAIYWFLPILLIFILALWDWKKNKTKIRLALLPLLGLGAATLLWFYWNRLFFKAYYLTAFLNETDLRLKSLGLTSTQDILLLYPRVLTFQFVGLMAIGFALLIAILWRYGRDASFRLECSPGVTKIISIFLSLTFLCPLVILTFADNKGPQVSGILVLPLFWLFYWLALKNFGAVRETKTNALVAGLVLALGLTQWCTHMVASQPYSQVGKNDAVIANSIFAKVSHGLAHKKGFPVRPDYIAKEVSTEELAPRLWHRPHIAVLDWVDGFNHNSVTLYGREQLGGSQILNLEIPRFIFSLSREELISALNRADAVILPINSQVLLTRNWPIAKSIFDNFTELSALTEKTMKLEDQFQYKSVDYKLYLRNDRNSDQNSDQSAKRSAHD